MQIDAVMYAPKQTITGTILKTQLKYEAILP